MNEKQYQSLCGWAARTPARQKCLTACFRLLPVLFGSRRLNCLGILLLPIACNMSGFGETITGWLGLT